VLTHLVQVIGEAASRLSPDLLARFPAVPWRQVVHDYFAVDLDILWAAASMDVPRLAKQVQDILLDVAATGRAAPIQESAVYGAVQGGLVGTSTTSRDLDLLGPAAAPSVSGGSCCVVRRRTNARPPRRTRRGGRT
jgi:hypothetical protein